MSDADPMASEPKRTSAASHEARIMSACGARVAAQVVLDLDLPHRDVQAAIRAKDESLLWRGYRAARDQKAWLDGVAASVGTHIRERQHFRDSSRNTPWQHVLIAWPVLLPPQRRSMGCASQHDRSATNGLLDQLHEWLGYRHEARLFTGVVGYDEICRWSPLAQRECLQLLARDTPAWRAPLTSNVEHLPSDFPGLAFVLGSVAEWIVHPRLPSPGASPDKDRQLQVQTAARVGFVEGCSVAYQGVGVPQRFTVAVLEGLRCWLREILQEGLVRSWQVHLACDDSLVLELVPATESSEPARIPLRLHQIGEGGLQSVLVDLEEWLGPAEEAGAHHG